MPTFSRPEYGAWLRAFTPAEISYERMSAPSGPLGKLVFDLAATCNMGCSYCFADRGRYGVKQPREKLLTPDTAAVIVRKVIEQCGGVGHAKFFGGEPLLNIAAIERICDEFAEAEASGRLTSKPTYNIITNGTVFTPKIAEVLRSNGVRMTVSVDGPKEIHDSQRTFINGRGTFQRISRNIAKFAEAGCRLGVLECVFTPRHVTEGYTLLSLYLELSDLFGDKFELIVLHPFDQPTLDESPDDGAKASYVGTMRAQTRELYAHLVQSDIDGPRRRFSEMMRMLTAEKRDENLCGVGYDTITVKPNGSVYSCYVFSENERFKYGNILSDSFWSAYKAGQLFTPMDQASRFNQDACSSCDIQRVCTHCLSGMNAESALNGQLPDINCDFYLGQIEGFFAALGDLHQTGRFDLLCRDLAGMPS